MIDIDRMVGRLMQLVQDAHLSASLGSSGKDGIAEIILGYHLRATECKEDSALLDALQSLHVQTGISLQCIMQGCTVLGKGWRIEDDEVILLVMVIEILESILADSLMTCIAREVESDILIGQLDGLGTAVYRVDSLGFTTHCIDRETACIAEHIEHALALGIMLQERAVLTLVYEETGLLTAQPVDMELQAEIGRAHV